jgi:hypothetical protein
MHAPALVRLLAAAAAIALPVLLTFSLQPARAQTSAAAPQALEDLAWRTVKSEEVHRLSADGTEVVTLAVSRKVLKPAALDAMKQATLSHSKSAQSLEVLQAYTTKADGRKIVVPKDNYQVRADTGRDNAGPAFSDQVFTTVVFPDVEVGDTITLSYKLATLQPLFPGKVSMIGSYPRSMAFDDVRVAVDYPDALVARYRAKGMQQRVSSQGGRTLVEWTLRNPQPVKNEREDFSVFDVESEPGYLFSTFDSYADVAQSYLARAVPKAAVTDRIRSLAEDIARDKAEPREQAKALYEWVATHITYGGNCIGIGAVVPRDLDTVLDNKMGDCKDHATLLQALLAAKGIRSEQALVNASNIFQLPDIPVAGLVNHVINYLPSLDLFVDSTDPTAPFGYLPMLDQDKPVLMAAQYGTRRTPPEPLGRSRQDVKTKMTVREDGSVEGIQHVALHGRYAIGMREGFKTLSKDDMADAVTKMLQGMGLKGSGTLSFSSTEGLSDDFEYDLRFQAKNVLPFPGSGAFYLRPLFFSPAPVTGWANQATMKIDEAQHLCVPGTSHEEYEMQLPSPMKVLSVPDPIAFSAKWVTYESGYRLEGAVLRAQRHLDDRTPGNLCSATAMRDYAASLEPVLKDVRQQVLYK